MQSSDGIVAEFSNAAILVACEEGAKPLLDELRPLLVRFGGTCMCLVSEAKWLKH